MRGKKQAHEKIKEDHTEKAFFVLNHQYVAFQYMYINIPQNVLLQSHLPIAIVKIENASAKA